jgi:hypothetical protein
MHMLPNRLQPRGVPVKSSHAVIALILLVESLSMGSRHGSCRGPRRLRRGLHAHRHPGQPRHPGKRLDVVGIAGHRLVDVGAAGTVGRTRNQMGWYGPRHQRAVTTVAMSTVCRPSIAIARSTGGRPSGAAVGDRRPDPGTSPAVAKSASTAAGGPPCAPGTPPPRLVVPRQHG